MDAQQMPITYERVAWYDTSAFLWIPYITIFLIFLFTIIIWFVKRYKKQKTEKPEQTVFARRAELLAYSLVVLNLVFILCFTPSVYLLSDIIEFGVPFHIKILLFVPIISSLLTIGLLIFTVIIWKRKVWNFSSRMHYSIITITCIGFIFWQYHWNWLGFHY